MRRILVTGASGFIGRTLVTHLDAQDFEVRAAARRFDAIPLGRTIERVALPDLSGPVDWTPLIQGVDAVVHLAGVAHRDGVDEKVYDQVIQRATSRLAAACTSADIDRLVFVSSIGAQTGSAANRVVTEKDEPRPVSAYDRAKLKAEEAVRSSGGPYTILRPVLVYGRGVKGNMERLMSLARSRWPLPAADLRSRRSLLALDNLIEAIGFCLSSDLARNETFIVADEQPISVAEMLALMRRCIGRAPGLYAVPSRILQLAARMAGPHLWDRIGRDLVVDPSKLLAIGWRPPLDISTGLKAMMISGLQSED
jgi:UDP-glucose 4-epimerase